MSDKINSITEQPSRVEKTGQLPVPPSDFITEKIQSFTQGWLVAWLHYQILILEVINGAVQYGAGEKAPDWEQYLLRLRLFDKNKEWHLWKTSDGFYARYREESENEGEENWHFTDHELMLWGTKTDNFKEGFVRVWEERGTELILPEKLGQLQQEDQSKRFVLTTRNYIDFNAIGQAGYVDSRFVNIHLKDFGS